MAMARVHVEDRGPRASAGRAVSRAGAERRCLATGRVVAKRNLLRFVVDGEGRLVPDLDGKLPGRGLWITPERGLVEQACRRNLFAKAARRAVAVADDLPDRLAALQRRRCLALIGMARRAGQLVAGFEKVRARLESGAEGILVQACDGARDGRDRLRRRRPDVPVVDRFTALELGAMLGREDVVHAWIQAGGLADRLLAETARLELLQGDAAAADQPLNGC
jgi:predicted RNA-binding protein YlxR (DUF448 family)/ribosomal protein L7Ae-like RNA K-turn-binding protein